MARSTSAISPFKNIYPATQAVDEQTHIIKLDVTHEFDDWHLADNARVEFYSENNLGVESQSIFAGTSPDTFINTQDKYQSTQGMNTLMLEKQIRDWWFLSGGFYYSKLDGSDFFNQTSHRGPCQLVEQPADHAEPRIGNFQRGQSVHAADLSDFFDRHAK